MRWPLTGGAAVMVIADDASPQLVAVDANNVYWTTNTIPSVVKKAPVGGGAPVTLASVSGLHP